MFELPALEHIIDFNGKAQLFIDEPRSKSPEEKKTRHDKREGNVWLRRPRLRGHACGYHGKDGKEDGIENESCQNPKSEALLPTCSICCLMKTKRHCSRLSWKAKSRPKVI